jgi:hypothetical protein
MAKKCNRPLKGLAEVVRKEFRDKDTHFFTSDVEAEVLRRAALDPRYASLALAEAVHGVCKEVDDAASNSHPPPWRVVEPDLPGLGLEGDFNLGGGERVGKACATWADAQTVLRLARKNRDDVNAAYKHMRDEVNKLKPYWEPPGTTQEQAVEGYLRDNPPGYVA